MSETMLHPFSSVVCDVRHLQPGDTVEEGDVYRSATVIEPKSALGTWFVVTDVTAGTVIGQGCNVHFIRLSPVDLPAVQP